MIIIIDGRIVPHIFMYRFRLNFVEGDGKPKIIEFVVRRFQLHILYK